MKSINALDNPVEYLNATVMCKIAPSKIHGIGVFAICDIPYGVKITDWNRDMRYLPFVYEMKEKDFMKLKKEIRELIMDKTVWGCSGFLLRFISPNSECYLQDFCNHSSTPNVDNNFVTLRDIKAGEEITEDFTKIVLQGGEMHTLSKQHYNFI